MTTLFESRFRDKLDACFAPTNEEVIEIDSILALPRARIAELTGEITRLEDALTRLRNERTRLETDVALHESLLAPIRKLPEDVLQEIFLACLPGGHNATLHPDHPPLLFGRVNRYWRRLSRSTPLLWRSAHVPGMLDFDDEDPEPVVCDASSRRVEKGLFGTFNRWMSLSVDAPLWLSYCERPPYDPPNPASVGSSDTFFGAAVAEHSQRIERLGVWGSAAMVRSILTLPPAVVPQLRSLVCIQCYNSSPTFDLCDAAVLQSEALESICLLGSCDPSTFTCHWTNLAELGLIFVPDWTTPAPTKGIDQNEMRNILRRCPNLVRCEIGITEVAPLCQRESIVLPNLEELFIYTGHGLAADSPELIIDICALFDALDAPNLWLFGLGQSHLVQLRRTDTARRTSADEMITYITPNLVKEPMILSTLRALPRTTSLFLCPADGSQPSVASTMHNLYQLMADNFFTTLVAENLCPDMRNLAIQMDITGPVLESSGLLDFIRARRTSLRALNLLFLYGYTEEIETQLRDATGGQIILELKQNDPDPTTVPRWKYDPSRGL
ncbi:F-box domain-containing protein [Mycena kentingensis (nom. inval.)]|nr:F-box domain-containing protein [Mycena kentingensis (nom. inval.)]